MRLLHISDLHFGAPYAPQVGEAALRAAGRLGGDVTVISGDLTQRAKREEFIAAREFLRQLPESPQVVVPGNHDVPLYRVVERFRQPHGLYREYISDELNTVHRFDEAVIVGLDSTSPKTATTNGRIRMEQLDYCRDAFANAPSSAARIVVAHHHFAPAPDYLHDQTMPKARRAINRFVELGVEMVLGGHLHRAYIGNSLDFYPGNYRDRGIVFVQCGTTTSQRGRGRERKKNSLNVIDIDAEMFHVTHCMYFHEEDEFVPVGRYLFPRPGKRFVEREGLEQEPARVPTETKPVGSSAEESS